METPYSAVAEFYELDQGILKQCELDFYSLELQVFNEYFVEYGCGTGRLLIPLSDYTNARAIGIDLSLEMLKQAKGKTGIENCLLICGDALTTTLSHRIDVGIASNNFVFELASTDEIEDFLKSARCHIKSKLIIDVFNPVTAKLEKLNCWKRSIGTYFCSHANDSVNVSAETLVNFIDQKIVTRIDYSCSKGDLIRTTTLYHHYLFPEQLIFLIRGFDWFNINMYGDYDRSPFVEGSSARLILVGEMI